MSPVGDDTWSEYAAGWDDDPAARAYAREAFRSLETALRERARSLDGAHVCDFGCGTGLLTDHLASRCEKIDAVDTSPAMLDVLRQKTDERGWTNVRLAARLEGEEGPYDLVVCSSVCGFLDDYPGTVDQLVALLEPHGLFVQWDWEASEDDTEEHGLSPQRIVEVLESAGLTSVDVDRGFEVTVEGQSMGPLMGVGEKPGAT